MTDYKIWADETCVALIKDHVKKKGKTEELKKLDYELLQVDIIL